MFNKQNFCHVASNNRNEKKAGIFVYKTTDDLATVTTNGYFNEKIIDINLHDLIIHEWHNPTDRTKTQKNVLCVTERTLDNVGTTLIKSKWETDIESDIEDIESDIENLETYVNNTFVKLNGTSTMTAPLKFQSGSMRGAVGPYLNGVSFWKMDAEGNITNIANLSNTQFSPVTTDSIDLGSSTKKFKTLYLSNDANVGGKLFVATINNGYDIAVPVTNSADTLALKSEVDLAANSGDQLYTTGVWYAKMYAATVVPTGAEYDGRNYADFSQVDNDNNPIIVIYEGQNGAWVQISTITPPATYNGYMTITSKIWDIPEQTGQQGGKVLWSHNQKTFTPYPQIVSFENAVLTGVSTAPTPTSSSPSNQIANKQYVEEALASSEIGYNTGDIFFTMRPDTILNGAVECDGTTYQTTDFTGTQSIGALLEDGKIPYVSLADYATALATNGSVGVFGWDGTNTTAFRVPKLDTNIFVQSRNPQNADLCGIYQPGVPNITGEAQVVRGAQSDVANGAFYISQNTAKSARNSDAAMFPLLGFDASRSSSVYRNNVNTVQPYAVRFRIMVQLMGK